VPPEQLLLASLLQAFYGIRSERLLLEQLHYNLLFRWLGRPIRGKPGPAVKIRRSSAPLGAHSWLATTSFTSPLSQLLEMA
jgi:hypothetical protein